MVKIGIIGGSGFDDPKILDNSVSKKVHTPYGAPSEKPVEGTVKGVPCVIIPRHGESHRLNPTNVNFRANIWALKELGCTHIIAPTACGSLREDIKPGHLIFIDQFIDRTTKRAQTFYEGQQVMHIPMAEPFCDALRQTLIGVAERLSIDHHKKGTMVTIEGPRFSTRAESFMFRQWGADTINMTTCPEAVLAREAGMHYAAIAMSTDYDCWKEGEEVSVETILRTMKLNSENTKRVILEAIPLIADLEDSCTADWRVSSL